MSWMERQYYKDLGKMGDRTGNYSGTNFEIQRETKYHLAVITPIVFWNVTYIIEQTSL